MSNQISIVEKLTELEKPFSTQNAWGLKFESECLFARQQIMKNDYVLNTAQNNPGSLRSAILNVAAIGISLNPAMAHAYLVPRDGAICLDVSYRGLVKLATESGAIEWAKAILVYEGDTFKWRGPNEQPLHEADVFDPERFDAENPLEKLRGGYCIAKLSGNGFLVDTMTAAEILAVRDSSKAFTMGKPGKKGPWDGKWGAEMAKKTLVKRASKSWPQFDDRSRLDQAIDVVNQHEGLPDEPVRTSDYLRPSKEQTEMYLELAKGDTVDFWLWYNAQDERLKTSLPGCEFERGQKQKMMAHFEALLKEGRERIESWAADLLSLCESADDHGVREMLSELPENQREALMDTLNTQYRYFAEQAMREAA